ncbi:MAG: hypothetical protein HUJ51_05495 [Eggerthellaceae bacterium]|nr:hypothetical protein [Eggerthellaceae bacterium]
MITLNENQETNYNSLIQLDKNEIDGNKMNYPTSVNETACLIHFVDDSDAIDSGLRCGNVVDFCYSELQNSSNSVVNGSIICIDNGETIKLVNARNINYNCCKYCDAIYHEAAYLKTDHTYNNGNTDKGGGIVYIDTDSDIVMNSGKIIENYSTEIIGCVKALFFRCSRFIVVGGSNQICDNACCSLEEPQRSNMYASSKNIKTLEFLVEDVKTGFSLVMTVDFRNARECFAKKKIGGNPKAYASQLTIDLWPWFYCGDAVGMGKGPITWSNLKVYTVTFDNNSGTGGKDEVTVFSGMYPLASINEGNLSTRKVYRFVGCEDEYVALFYNAQCDSLFNGTLKTMAFCMSFGVSLCSKFLVTKLLRLLKASDTGNSYMILAAGIGAVAPIALVFCILAIRRK